MAMRLSNALLTIIAALIVAAPVGAAPALAQDPPTAGFSLLPQRPINRARFGLNAFVNDQRFGTIPQQMNEVRNTLGVRFVRVLFAWNDDVQPSPSSAPNFSFYDDIAAAIPPRSDALVILTGVPSWMSDSRNWIDGNPRLTFVKLWAQKVMARYRRNRRIVGWEIWNEQNDEGNPQNAIMGMQSDPAAYVEMLRYARQASKRIARGKKVVAGATTAINQNFPETLAYNEQMVEAGVESLADVYAIHYYGTSIENVLIPGGVGSFVKSLTRPIWLTECGERGVNDQLEYVREIFPFLQDLTPRLRRFYYYQFTEDTPAGETYGLKNLTPGRTVSDLYIHLRDNR